jgi:amino acid transporter
MYMKAIHNVASGFFICAVVVLSAISILGVWDLFSTDVITKSFQTLGLLALISVVAIVAGRFVDDKAGVVPAMPELPNPIFKTIRQATLGVLIIAAVLLALIGVMAIWDVITDKAVLSKALTSLAILAFSAFVIVVTCLEREDSPILKDKNKVSAGGVIGIAVLAYLVYGLLL